MKITFLVVMLVLFLHATVLTGDAHAYLDPGTGGMLVQALLAVIVGVIVAIKMTGNRILYFLYRIIGRKIEEDDDDESASDSQVEDTE